MKAFVAVVVLIALAFGGVYVYLQTDLLAVAGIEAKGRPHTYFQYVDGQGRLQFAETLEAVPERWRDRAGRVVLDRPPAEAAAAARSAPAKAAKSTAKAGAGAAPGSDGPAPDFSGQVVIYTENGCIACKKAVRHLVSRGVDYVERNINEDSSAEAAYRKKAGFAGGMPLIEVGSTVVEGYDRAKLNRALDGI